MPSIKSSTDLENNYNEISAFCHNSKEPMFITKNGQGDLAVMSIETYEMLNGKLELYRLLDEGRTAVKAGNLDRDKTILLYDALLIRAEVMRKTRNASLSLNVCCWNRKKFFLKTKYRLLL